MLRLLGLKQQVERELHDRGMPVTITTSKKCLRILTDSEALEYNPHHFGRHHRGMTRSHSRTMRIDTGELSEAEQDQHTQVVMVQSRLLLAFRRERKQLRLEATPKQLPPNGNGEGG